MEPWEPPDTSTELGHYVCGYLARNLADATSADMHHLLEAIDVCIGSAWISEDTLRSLCQFVVLGVTGYGPERMTVGGAIALLSSIALDIETDDPPDVTAKAELSELIGDIRSRLEESDEGSDEGDDMAPEDDADGYDYDEYEAGMWDAEMAEEEIGLRDHLESAARALKTDDVDTLETELEVLLTEVDVDHYVDLARLISVLRQTYEGEHGVSFRNGDTENREKYAEELAEVAIAVRALADTLCRLIAREQRALDGIEWRDLERVVASALDGLGFSVELTPPAKDGGRDIIAHCYLRGDSLTYYVEIKHWRSAKRVGIQPIKDFLELNAYDHTDGGLFLSTSGYTSIVQSHMTEICSQRVHLGARSKVVSLCKHYVRHREGVWQRDTALPCILFEDTLAR